MPDPLIAVISSGRPRNVPGLHQLLGTDQASWYVGQHEARDYQLCGARRVIPAGGLVAARNQALADAAGAGLPCVQVSDDLRKLQERTEAGAVPCTWARALELLWDAQRATGARVAGASPTSNAMFADPARPHSRDAFLVGDLLLVLPDATPRFDPALPLKEDYDYTCQHLATYGVAARANLLLPTFLHRRNPGGAVTYRNAQLEDEAIAYLQAKWPGAIRPNPKRPHEVLLRWASREQATA